MKTLIFILFILFTLGCNKKKTTVKPKVQSQAKETKVYCMFLTNFNMKVFYYCAKDEKEMQTKQNELIDQGQSFVIEVKTKCGDCQ